MRGWGVEERQNSLFLVQIATERPALQAPGAGRDRLSRMD
jgi:hypothetical protein